MRIALDATLLYHPFSGVEHCIYELLRALPEARPEHQYLAFVPSDFDEAAHPLPGVQLVRQGFAGQQRLRRIVFQQFLLPRLIARERPALFHGPGYVLPLRCPVPAIVTIYDVLTLTQPQWARRSNVLHYRYVLPRTAALAQAIIVPSDFTKWELHARTGVPEQKMHVIPPGVRQAFHPVPLAEQAAVRERYGIPHEFFLCVGNLEPRKNHGAVLAALTGLCRRYDAPHHLVIVGAKAWRPLGSGHPAGALEDFNPLLARLNCADRVHWLSAIPDQDLAALYCAAEALIFPSLYEGFGLPPLEAMACGTPVLAADRGASREITAEAGLLLPIPEITSLAEAEEAQRAVEALVEAMNRLSRDLEFRAHLRERGLERARQFTWQRHAQAVAALYDQVA